MKKKKQKTSLSLFEKFGIERIISRHSGNPPSGGASRISLGSWTSQDDDKKNAFQISSLSIYGNIIKFLVVVSFFVFVGSIYFHNMTQDVYSGDIGDLVTASCVFGVAHPPGYPLFTMLGGLLCNSPLPLPPVTKVALISAISSFLGLIIFYKFAYRVSKDIFISLLSTSILGFSYLYWLHAEIPELFGFNNFFIIIILFFGILFYLEKKTIYLYPLAFFTGLSLTHHHIILFILPGIFLLVIKEFRTIFRTKKQTVLLFSTFALGLIPYIYVPFVALQNPVVNWDQAYTLKNFIRLITRQDYGGFGPSVVNQVPTTVKLALVQDYFKTLISNYSYQILFVFIVGFMYILKINKWLFVCLLFTFLFSGPFYAYYGASIYTTSTAIGIIERFYNVSFTFLAFLLPFGFLQIYTFLSKRFSKKTYAYIIIGYFLIIPALQFMYNFPKNDLSKTRIGNTLADDILNSVPKNGILFVSGDTTTFNIWYNYYVLKKRQDIDIINPPGVGGNVFLDNAINEYHKNNPGVPIKDVLNKTLEYLQKRRKIYSTYLLSIIPSDSILLAKGLVYELVYKEKIPDEKSYIEYIEKDFKKIKPPRREMLPLSEQNLVVLEIPLIYSNSLIRVGDFIDEHYKNPAKSETYYRRALWIEPENPAGYSGLALIQYKAYKDCNNAIQNMNEAIMIYPIWQKYYIQLYALSLKCNIDKKELEKQRKKYHDIFKENPDKNLKLNNSSKNT